MVCGVWLVYNVWDQTLLIIIQKLVFNSSLVFSSMSFLI